MTSVLSRQQKEQLLRQAAAARSAASAPSRITARRRKPAVPPDVQRLSEAQVDRLLSGFSTPRFQQIRKELPRMGTPAKRLLLLRLLEAAYRDAATARISYAQQRSWFLQSLAPDSGAQTLLPRFGRKARWIFACSSDASTSSSRGTRRCAPISRFWMAVPPS